MSRSVIADSDGFGSRCYFAAIGVGFAVTALLLVVGLWIHDLWPALIGACSTGAWLWVGFIVDVIAGLQARDPETP